MIPIFAVAFNCTVTELWLPVLVSAIIVFVTSALVWMALLGPAAAGAQSSGDRREELRELIGEASEDEAQGGDEADDAPEGDEGAPSLATESTPVGTDTLDPDAAEHALRVVEIIGKGRAAVHPAIAIVVVAGIVISRDITERRRAEAAP